MQTILPTMTTWACQSNGAGEASHAFPLPVADVDSVLAGVLEAVESLAGPIGLSRDEPGPNLDAQSRNLLRVLAYSYATGVFASNEIESALNGDPVLLYLADGERHESGRIRTFRRRNRPAIQRCLARTLENSWCASHPGAQDASLASHSYVRCALDRWSNPTDRPDFELEAANRLRQAVCDDTALLDE